MAKHNCENCGFRAKYDNNPQSLLGRLWRWHIGWCPGWKRFVTSLSEERRIEIKEQYGLDKNKYS